MKNKLEYTKQTWTYNHKLLIISLSLALAHVWPLLPLPALTLASEQITYEKAATIEKETLEKQVEKRAIELYEQNKANDLEKYRHNAIKEINEQLQTMVYDSPFVDYDALKDKYGY
jgi:hypothetical protein